MFTKFKTLLIFLLILCLYIVLIKTTRTDLTRQDGAHGVDVVEAVIALINKSGIFANDYGFMKRLAYIESKFGDDPKTFALRNGRDYNGGIWQVDNGPYGAFTISQTTTTTSHQQIPRIIELL